MSKRSSNNNNGLSSSNNKHENGWPCLVYRLQSHRGWEVYTDEDLQSTTTSNKKNKSNKEYLLRVEPTEGSIEVKQMRIRIPLKQDEDKRLNTNYEDGGGWNNNPLIVRRRNSLLVSVRRGYGAIMFYFKSVTECKEFCDELVFLNRDLLTPAKSNNIGENASSSSSSSSANDGRYVNGMNKRELHIDEMIGNKRNRRLAFGDNDIATQKLLPTKRSEYDSVEDKPAKVEEIQQCQRQEEMMSYITKLAHSEEFRGFVHELERGLDSSILP